MKVKELIAELQKYNCEREVLVSMEMGCGKVSRIEKDGHEVIIYT